MVNKAAGKPYTSDKQHLLKTYSTYTTCQAKDVL